MATYTLSWAADLWTLIADLPMISPIVTPGTVVIDMPLTTLCSGYHGAGSSFAQLPLWMCAGCGPFAFFRWSVTTRPPLVSRSIAVPVSPEPFCAFIGMVIGAFIIAMPPMCDVLDIEPPGCAPSGAAAARTTAAPNAATERTSFIE